jgi:hypothetical protein
MYSVAELNAMWVGNHGGPARLLEHGDHEGIFASLHYDWYFNNLVAFIEGWFTDLTVKIAKGWQGMDKPRTWFILYPKDAVMHEWLTPVADGKDPEHVQTWAHVGKSCRLPVNAVCVAPMCTLSITR